MCCVGLVHCFHLQKRCVCVRYMPRAICNSSNHVGDQSKRVLGAVRFLALAQLSAEAALPGNADIEVWKLQCCGREHSHKGHWEATVGTVPASQNQ